MLFWIGAFLGVTATASVAQIPGLTPAVENDGESPPAVEAEPVVVPFTLAEAGERLAEQERNLNAAVQLVEDPTVNERVSGRISEVGADLRLMRRELIQIDRLNQMQLGSMRDRSRHRIRQLGELQRQVTRRLAALEEQRTIINDTLVRWDRTEEIFGEDLPPSLRGDLGAYRNRSTTVLEQIRLAVDDILALQSRIQAVKLGFTTTIERIDEAAAQQMVAMWSMDQPPLWRSEARRVPLSGVGSVADQLRDVRQQLQAFAGEFRINLIVHLLTTLLLVVVLVHFRQRLHRSEDAPRMADGVASILDRPFSAALLVMVLAATWFYPYVVPAASHLAGVVLCIPLFRLLPRLIPRPLRPAIITFIALGLTDALAMALLGQTFIGRVVQMLLMIPLAAVVAWGGLRAVELARRTSPGKLLMIRIVVWPNALMFIGCGVAILLGYLQMAAFLYSIAFTAAFAALLYFALTRVLSGGLVMLLQSRVAGAVNSVCNNQLRLLRSGLRLVKFVAAVGWLLTVLTAAGLLSGVVAAVTTVLEHPIGVGSLSFTPGRVLAFALTLWISIHLARIVAAVLDNDMLPRVDLGRGVAGSVSKLTQYIILSIGILLALAAAGVELQNLALLATAFSIGIGFGLQTLVNNFVSGLILMFERPVQIGDVVEVSGRTGEVRRIGIRSSTVRLFDGAELVVPNGNLISNDLINWTLSDKFRRIEIVVGVAYGSDLRRTKEILEACANAHPDISENPPPSALFAEFADSSIDFALRCWTIPSDRVFGIRSDLAIRVSEALAEAGIEISFPQLDLHLKSSALGSAVAVPSPEAAASPVATGPTTGQESPSHVTDSSSEPVEDET